MENPHRHCFFSQTLFWPLDKGPIDCNVAPWTKWSACGKACGPKAVVTRSRTINWKPQNDGKPCPKLHQTRRCGPKSCIVKCKLSKWSCGDCSRGCQPSRQCTRMVLQKANADGIKQGETIQENHVPKKRKFSFSHLIFFL